MSITINSGGSLSVNSGGNINMSGVGGGGGGLISFFGIADGGSVAGFPTATNQFVNIMNLPIYSMQLTLPSPGGLYAMHWVIVPNDPLATVQQNYNGGTYSVDPWDIQGGPAGGYAGSFVYPSIGEIPATETVSFDVTSGGITQTYTCVVTLSV